MTTTRSNATKKATPRRPDDQPFDFNLDTVEPEQELTPFVFQWDGRRWEFANINDLDCWELIEMAAGGDKEVMLGSFKLALGDQYEDFRKVRLPAYKVDALFRAWLKHSGVDPDKGTPLAAS